MLDPSKIGEPEPRPALKCESCGQLFEDNEYSATDWQHIDELGECVECSDHSQTND